MSLSPVSGKAWHKWWVNIYKHQQKLKNLHFPSLCVYVYLGFVVW